MNMLRTQPTPPRAAIARHAALQKTLVDASPPAVNSISWRLWLATQDIAKLVLSSRYIQGIADGTLDPEVQHHYLLQDYSYCYLAQQDFVTIQRRAEEMGHPQLSTFAQARVEQYDVYVKRILEALNLTQAGDIVLSAAAQDYIKIEQFVATRLNPIYGALAMIPCSQLWAWLVEELSHLGSDNDIYRNWAKNINSWDEVFCLDNFIDAWFKRNPQDYRWELALYVFRSSMIGELNFFRSVFGQSLMAYPTRPSS